MKRPLALSLLSLFTGILYGIFSLLLITGLLFYGDLSAMMQEYSLDDSSTGIPLILLLSAGLILHMTALWGVLRMWQMHSRGYYLFAIPTLLLALTHLFRPDISWVFTILYILLIILFGIAFRTLRR